jgi:hypothetical protein
MKDQLSRVLKMQRYYEKNHDIRPYSEIAKELPLRFVKSVSRTTTVGTVLTFSSSFSVFQKLSTANGDLSQSVPVLGAFATTDFALNCALTRMAEKRVPERWMAIASSSVSGPAVGYFAGSCSGKSAAFGAVCAAVHGLESEN